MRVFTGIAIAFVPLSILLLFPVYSCINSGPPDELTSRLHGLYVAASIYQADFSAFPDMSSPDRMQAALSRNHLSNSDAFRNPLVTGPIHGNPALSGKRQGKLWADEDEIALFWALNGRTDRPITAVHMDGHSRRYTLQEWRAIKTQSRIP
jgi:hypothetical protein